MQGSQGDAPAPVVPVERDLCVTLLHETTWHRCVDFVSKKPQPWVPACARTTVVQKVSGDGNPSPSPPLDSGPRLHEGRLFAAMTVVRRAACPVLPPSPIIPITKSHESQFRRSAAPSTPLNTPQQLPEPRTSLDNNKHACAILVADRLDATGRVPRRASFTNHPHHKITRITVQTFWTLTAHPCYHPRVITPTIHYSLSTTNYPTMRHPCPILSRPVPRQIRTVGHHLPHFSQKCPITQIGMKHFGTEWDSSHGNRPTPRPNYSLTRPPQLPIGSVTAPNSLRSRSIASADKGPMSTDSTFCSRWTGSMVPVMTVETPSV